MKKLIVWIFNAVVALMSLLAIACYFIGPVWEIDVKYPMSAEQLNRMIGSSLSDYDVEIKEGVELSVNIKIGMNVLISSLGSNSEATVQKIIDSNVDGITEQLHGTINTVADQVIKSAAGKIVSEKVHDQVKELLPGESDEEINRKLEAAGIDDNYISKQTEDLVNSIFAEDASVDKISEQVIQTVEDVCDKLANSGDPSLSNAKVSDADKEKIQNTVKDALSSITESDGSINVNDYINNLIVEALRSMKGNGKSEGRVALLAAESGNNELKEEVRSTIKELIPESLVPIFSFVLIGVLGLVILSSLAWLYILIKLIVKLVTFPVAEPTVKLKLPIILGWLPYLILAAIPSLVFAFAPNLLATFNADLAGLTLSFASIGWFALLSASICFVISIFYMVVRRASKKAN